MAAILLPAPLLAGNRKSPTEVLSGAIITRVYSFILAEEWGFSSINRKKTAFQDRLKKCRVLFTKSCATFLSDYLVAFFVCAWLKMSYNNQDTAALC